MKRVRFETPIKAYTNQMEENECHSPRPFIERQPSCNNAQYYERVIPYNSDPVQRFECSNSSPYPLASKMNIPRDVESKFLPSNELDLSMLDASYHEPRQPICRPSMLTPPTPIKQSNHVNTKILSSLENQIPPQNVSPKVDDFFIRRDKLDKYLMDTNNLNNNFKSLRLDKENNPLEKKAELMRVQAKSSEVPSSPVTQVTQCNNHCACHHCIKPVLQRQVTAASPEVVREHVCQQIVKPQQQARYIQCYCNFSQSTECFKCIPNIQHPPKPCHWSHESKISPLNALERKTLAIQKLEQNNKNDCMEVEKQTNITKEKREPTVADLFKIIKLQNEQLQLLQEKVDKFISAGNNAQNLQPPIIQQYTEKVVHSVDSEISEQHKISIGVMTSFEMVRTSTVINKEFVKQTVDNAQIQCNRSQISIKEVITKNQPVNLNFLDGIMPVEKNVPNNNDGDNFQTGNNEDKMINELSLYDVQVDNATTPYISPEQSLYLDVRDYSDSESGSDDQSNVGWTYYNKVMTHVNGMLQDSDMPSSASALYRNTRQKCVQMQIDKTNLSVTKRVKFGDDPLGVHQPHLCTAASTDTSMKMNQLAAKYLKTAPIAPQRQKAKNVDMSLATRNYMERHKLIQGVPSTSHSPHPGEMPRFLDITALKQQPKFL